VLCSFAPACAHPFSVGWSSAQAQQPQAQAYTGYDQTGGNAGGIAEPGVKARLVTLISAVRTLLRRTCLLSSIYVRALICLLVPLIIVNLVIIVYELILGG
jgi:hypothetical protein